MKIEHIQAQNFLRLNFFDADLSDATVHLFAGNNEAGKTSIQEAIRFALLGETVRVGKTKAARATMIRDGAKAGSASVVLDGRNLTRDIKTAAMSNTVMEGKAAQLPTQLTYLLNAHRFSVLSPDDRRAFLFELTRTKVDKDNVVKRMKAKGVTDDCIEACLPMLRSGFDATHKYAVETGTELRGEWQGVTGRKHGSVLAEGWQPAPPEGYDPDALAPAQKELETIQDAIDQLNINKGRTAAAIADAKQNAAPVEPFDKEQLTVAMEEAEVLNRKITEERTRLGGMNAELANAREKAPVVCCECGAMLRVSYSGKQTKCEKFTPLGEDERAQLQADIITLSDDIGRMEVAITGCENIITKQRRLERALQGAGKTVDAKLLEELEFSLSELNEAIATRANERDTLNEQVIKLREKDQRVRDAEAIEARASELNQQIKDWKDCYTALAPDGIQAEILADALKPINDRLKDTASTTRWPLVTISPTMEVMADGRVYNLLSESAQWRADAAITDAISYLSDLGIMILDRIDVLDIASRGILMNWMNAIKAEYDTIMLFGTLKSAPATMPDGMKSYWIDNGEIKE